MINNKGYLHGLAQCSDRPGNHRRSYLFLVVVVEYPVRSLLPIDDKINRLLSIDAHSDETHSEQQLIRELLR